MNAELGATRNGPSTGDEGPAAVEADVSGAHGRGDPVEVGRVETGRPSAELEEDEVYSLKGDHGFFDAEQ